MYYARYFLKIFNFIGSGKVLFFYVKVAIGSNLLRIGSNLSMMVLLNECLRFADWWHQCKQYQLHMPLFFVMQRLDIMNDVPNSGLAE